MKKVAIIGGGASALMCACFVNQNVELTIFESSNKLGKKILASGNGRCNLTNLKIHQNSYNYDITKYINRFGVNETLDFFGSIGLEYYSDEENRVYPISNSSSSVLDCLLNCIYSKKNIHIKLDSRVTNILKENNKFYVHFNDSYEIFDNVVIASGNATSLDTIRAFGIKTKDFYPSLCALKTKKQNLPNGERVQNVAVSAKIQGTKFYEKGEVLFKKDGISGIVVFNLSSIMARKNTYYCDVFLDFMPNISQKELIFKLNKRKESLSKYKIKNFFDGMFVGGVTEMILSTAGQNYEKNISLMTEMDIRQLAEIIKNFKLETNGYFDNNQVCSGGVCVHELDNNLQSKCKGLYFMGEVVDVDGMCGGYNLQWAWTSGKIVGDSL